jgi:hypothetical protein
MSEQIEQTVDSVEQPRKPLPIGWYALTGALALIIIVLLIKGGIAAKRFDQQLKHERATLQAEIEKMKSQHELDLMHAMEEKGKAIVNTFAAVEPNLMLTGNQRDEMFRALLGDKQIAYVALVDAAGNVYAATDLALEEEGTSPLKDGITLRGKPGHGADLEVSGPVKAGDRIIGGVRVGLTRAGRTVNSLATPPAQSKSR